MQGAGNAAHLEISRAAMRAARKYPGPATARTVDAERETLIGALLRKDDSARVVSLVTILKNPPNSPPEPAGFSYPLPFPRAVIVAVATNFYHLPESALYLRLPDAILAAQQKQIASNFIGLTDTQELMRSATLLCHPRNIAHRSSVHR